jgi:hypothetical protein
MRSPRMLCFLSLLGLLAGCISISRHESSESYGRPYSYEHGYYSPSGYYGGTYYYWRDED